MSNPELLNALERAYEILKPFHAEILSIGLSSTQIDAHIRGTEFSGLVHELKPVVEGSFAASGYHCSFDLTGKPIRIHSLLQ